VDKLMNIKVLYIFLLVLGLLFLVSPFVIPIFFAGTIALTLQTPFKFLISKGFKRKQASAVLTLLFAFVVSLPLLFFIIQGTMAVTAKLESLSSSGQLKGEGVKEIFSGIRHDVVEFVHKMTSKYHVGFLNEKKIEEYMSLGTTFLLNFFRDFLTSLPTLFILFIIMILCTYSFLNHGYRIRHFFQILTGFSDEKMDHLIHIFIMDSRQVYLSNIITGGIQSLIVALGVSLLGLGDFLIVFFVTLILSFIPVIGAAPVAFVFSFVAFLKGHSMAAVILLILGSVTGVVDNILRPWLATFGESRIPPIVAFICVIGGALWLGFPGLFIGLLIGSIAFDTLPFFWKELEVKKESDLP
jgi:predicted PurR-regulated permease PerM